jgi:LemA protein
MIPAIVIGAILLLLVAFVIGIYNKLTKQRINVKEAWSGIGTFLQQRNDLIPNLVETVKGYAIHESSTLTEVIKWRNKGAAAATPGDQIAAAQGLNKALVDFFAVAEQYPDLKANTNFLQLQQDLRNMEEKINQSRRYYNGTVRDFNQGIAVFPNNLVASSFGFTSETFFKEDESATAVPQVKF